MGMVKQESLTDWIVAVVHEENGIFGISFPDFPGCVSGGNSFEEAVRKGESALAFHVSGMIEEGGSLPSLRTYAQLRADPNFVMDAADGTVVAVPLHLPGKSVRLNISLDERLLEQVDKAAKAAGQSRSAFLAEAARNRLQRP